MKQDIDPFDWMGRLAANLSGGEEANILAANTLMAPNADSGIFGNPEDQNKFLLTHTSQLQSMPFGKGQRVLWQLSDNYLPVGCENVTTWEQSKMGMAGELTHLRVLNQGMWHPVSASSGCGIEILAVAAPPVVNSSNTTAFLRVSSITSAAGVTNTTYLRIEVADNGAGAFGSKAH